ncbi:MAG TPA: polysaccharide deacetylase family sporulation protein PdaB [Clostridiales bacterium UBA8153]|nr:polysaccharide deacetylase family sporulation protein PdaB [Clostridiales bacterium UBA8153]
MLFRVTARTVWPAVFLCLAGTFAAAYWLGLERPIPVQRTWTAPGTVMPRFYVATPHRRVALTFDISWGTQSLALVLPVLAGHNVKATFLLSGPWAQRHPHLVRSIVQAGHEIASHGHRHDHLSRFDRAYIADNLGTAHRLLRETSGQTPRFFRPPDGDYDDLVVTTARELGYETVIWAVDSLDWRNPGVDFMVDRVLRQAFRGAIVLFHASDSAQSTHLALPRVISGLRGAGYSLVTLGELVAGGTPARDDPRGRKTRPVTD